MGNKMLVVLMMEGKFLREGLQSMDTDDDLMSAMARELVEKVGVGESADAIWRELDQEREKSQPRPVIVYKAETADGEVAFTVTESLPSAVIANGLNLVEPPPRAERKKGLSLWSSAPTHNSNSLDELHMLLGSTVISIRAFPCF